MQPIPLKPDAGAVARAERRSPGAGNHGDDVGLPVKASQPAGSEPCMDDGNATHEA